MAIGKKLVSHTSVYFLGTVLRYAISFVMLPIYTRVLTPADYGTIELLTTIIDFTGLIFGLQLGTAVFRFYSEFEEVREQHEVISTAVTLVAAVSVVGLLVLWSVARPLSGLLLGGAEYSRLLVVFALTLLFQPLAEIPMTFIRAQQRPWLFILFRGLQLFVQLSLNIYLVVFLRLGVEGVVLSAVISSGLMALLQVTYCLRITGFRFSAAKANMLISFTAPMILAGIVGFYITFGDRYFLKFYGTLTDVGIYALGYKFGFLLTVIGSGPFLSAWDSEKYLVLKSRDAKSVFQTVFVSFASLTIVMAVLISVFAKNILMAMAAPEFWRAAAVVPVILIAYLLQGWSVFCNLGILVERKTILMTKSTFLAAGVITIGYAVLIPRYGPMGAAWATAAAWGARFLYLYWKAKAYYDMELPWKRIFLLLPPSGAAVLASSLGPTDLFLSLLVNIIVAFSFLFSLTALPVLPRDQRLRVRKLLVRPWTAPREIRGIIKGA